MTLICAICGKTVELGAEPGAGKSGRIRLPRQGEGWATVQASKSEELAPQAIQIRKGGLV